MAEERSIAVFTNVDGSQVQIPITDGEVWATQAQIAEVFGTTQNNVSKHLTAIFESGELERETSITKSDRSHGGRPASLYSLDAVISVGYRVNSAEGTRFRIWATQYLSSIATNGFAIDESNPDAVRNAANRIRSLRTSEAEIYRRVRDVFAAAAIDYDRNSDAARSFFAMAQDKFHYAVTGKTAAELVLERCDANKPLMGLQTYAGEKPALRDAQTGKNYLAPDELHVMEILAEQFLLYAESKAFRGHEMTMEEITTKLNQMLQMNDYPVLYKYPDAYLRGNADKHAERQRQIYLESLPEGYDDAS